jgi:hypothetical protein
LSCCEATGGALRARRVDFRHQPLSPLAVYRRYFGCDVRFGQSADGIVYGKDALACLSAPTTMRVFIPLTIRKRNGRPKILPPADMTPDTGGVDPHVLKAIARAWSWRRKLESGAVGTISDIAKVEDVSSAYVGRMLKLAYIASAVLEKLLLERAAPAVSVKDLALAADMPWVEQEFAVFEATKLQ